MSNPDCPVMLPPQRLDDAWTQLPAWMPVPGAGSIAVNAFLRGGAEPLLVDTGLAALREDFIAALESQVDLAELRWIWLSHTDADHIGNLDAILARAPKARVLTNFLGVGKMGLMGLDASRADMLEMGHEIELAGTRMKPLRPPYYDAPETMGFFDIEDGTLFLADSFGAVLPQPVEDFGAIDKESLRDGMQMWAGIDAPWLADIDPDRFGRTLARIEGLAPRRVLSGHLPAFTGALGDLSGLVRAAAGAARRAAA